MPIEPAVITEIQRDPSPVAEQLSVYRSITSFEESLIDEETFLTPPQSPLPEENTPAVQFFTERPAASKEPECDQPLVPVLSGSAPLFENEPKSDVVLTEDAQQFSLALSDVQVYFSCT